MQHEAGPSTTPDVLARIVANTRAELADSRARYPLAELVKACSDLPPCRPFAKAVCEPGPGLLLGVIAEVKQMSPSAGVIKPTGFDPAAQAAAYVRGGASAISCLTDQRFFGGRLDYIAAIRAAVDVPILRKDFTLDRYHLYQARAAGADAVLLIAECLDARHLADLLDEALDEPLGLSVLAEVHEQAHAGPVAERLLSRARAGRPVLFGINNRDLRRQQSDVGHTARTLAELPAGLAAELPVISESGIRRRSEVLELVELGVRGVLVGETLMRSGDPAESLQELAGVGQP